MHRNSTGKVVVEIPEEGGGTVNMSIHKDGQTTHRCVSAVDLVQSLTSSFEISTGVLPRGTRFYSGSVNKYKVGIEVLGRIRKFYKCTSDGKKKELLIPFPTCLFVFDVKDQRLVNSRVFAIKNVFAKTEDQLYNFPFGNSYVRNGQICWGSAKSSKILAPMSLVGLVSSFLDSGYNGDLFENNRTVVGKDIGDFWSLVKSLHNAKEFPNTILKSCPMTLSNIMREKNV